MATPTAKPVAAAPPAPCAAKSAPQGSCWLRLENLAVPLDAGLTPTQQLRATVAQRLQLGEDKVGELQIVRRALDARRQRVGRSFTVDVLVPQHDRPVQRALQQNRATPAPAAWARRLVLPRRPEGPAPVVVGAGPAGLFAALTLAEAGWPAVLLERGRPVEQRSRDVAQLYAHGTLQPDSNVCYGEGGAGTYSDGKLYTRVGDARVDGVMRHLVAMGAHPDILVHNRPHLGTDKLLGLLQNIRARLTALGTTLRFETALADLQLERGALRRLVLRGGERLDAPQVILATGHSARDVWGVLHRQQIGLEPRPFAVGLRVEHPQALINEARYGRALSASGQLPAADYRLTYQDRSPAAAADDAQKKARAAFSFCMCPGGVVVATPTEQGALCINGMSHASRQGRYANSALVATVDQDDFARAGHHGTFAGADFQDEVERKAYLAGGGNFVAPAARVADFVAGRISTELGKTSYRRGIVPADLAALYPAAIVATLRRALARFDAQIPGFVSQEATLIGVETRTAAPVRLPRGQDGMAIGARGLYPAGEGLGYGGGIVSAAVDGVRAAEALLLAHGATWQQTELA